MVASENVERAAAALRAGELVAFPTETVYGLGADASNAQAVQKLYAVKRRPADHPVIVHVADVKQLEDIARDVPDIARTLAQAFWPGPLTLVVNRNPECIVPEVTGGRDTVGVRVPDHPLAQQLLYAFGGGVAAPSANRFGKVSPTTAAHVRADLGDDVTIVLDGGPCRVGIESTIVDVTGAEPAILRVGGITRAQIEATIGRPCALRTGGETAAPGTLASHYAPLATVELIEGSEIASRSRELLEKGQRVGVLALTSALADRAEALPGQLIVLDAPHDTDQFAQVLYARLRAADELHLHVLLIIGPPAGDGLGAAVTDRIRRAANR